MVTVAQASNLTKSNLSKPFKATVNLGLLRILTLFRPSKKAVVHIWKLILGDKNKARLHAPLFIRFSENLRYFVRL